MEGIYSDVFQFLRKPAIYDAFLDVLLCVVPIWAAVMIGLVIGWSWRPRWTGLIFLGLRGKFRFLCTAPPGFGARRLWLAFTALSAFSVCRKLWSNFTDAKGKCETPGVSDSDSEERISGTSPSTSAREGEKDVVTEKDLEHLLHLLDGKVGDVAWQPLMERSTQSMTYQAWRHDPEVGPTEYRSRTVFEDATPELVRDFFWDDDFRVKWDPMLVYFKILEECQLTGTMIVHWIKKFPFFCSDREYIIGRRIWESGRTYYCVTKPALDAITAIEPGVKGPDVHDLRGWILKKNIEEVKKIGVPFQALPKSEKPRRVEFYYSSWCIRAVESRKQDGQLSACEVTLVHYEDMGIAKDVAKVGVRHGMWGAVKKLQSGMSAYQLSRKSDASLSSSALMAQINTKIFLESRFDSSEVISTTREEKNQVSDSPKADQGICWKWVLIGGTVAVVCGLHTGIVGKALLLAGGRRIARR